MTETRDTLERSHTETRTTGATDYIDRVSFAAALEAVEEELRKPRNIRRQKFMPYDQKEAMGLLERIGRTMGGEFTVDADNRFLYENLIRWAHNDPSFLCNDPSGKRAISGRTDRGIYISGPTGTGKTWAMRVLARYCSLMELRVAAGDKAMFLSWDNVRASRLCSAYAEEGTLQCADRDILGIDDLGAEQTETMYMGSRLNVLQSVLEERGDRRDRLTFITSNIPMSRLADRYEERVASRVRQMCNYFELRGQDRR